MRNEKLAAINRNSKNTAKSEESETDADEKNVGA